ncbi:MAG: PorT family protein [Tannerella sp.]|jgi:hypothetical protein|nr:PorT family protein [Tannerella sp.]
MKKIFFLLTAAFICADISAQDVVMPKKDKVLNFGMKVGLNSALPVSTHISVDGMTIENAHVLNKVGSFAGVMARINVDHFFLQPSVLWKHTKCNFLFDAVEPPSEERGITPTFSQSLVMRLNSLEAPIVLGYDIVKENPYLLSCMAGVKLRYDYDVRFSSKQTYIEYQSITTPYHLAICTAFQVVIGRITFDAGYEFGISPFQSDFIYKQNQVERNMSLDSRLNGLNISLGLLF